ncbi:McrC family protein [Bacillus toyonensis]|nr:McrC family protein [Bacillus toyonensis]
MFGNRLGMKRIDLFQMYAYLTRYDCAQTAILIYPKQFALELDYNTQIES